MFISDIKYFISQYLTGIKYISYFSSRPTILKHPPQLVIKKTLSNFQLHFSQTGILLESVHDSPYKKHKMIYDYNNEGLLIGANALDPKTNKRLARSLFQYDFSGRITKETVFNNFLGYEMILINKHIYDGNSHKILMISNDKAEVFTINHLYDTTGRIVEKKSIIDQKELVEWSLMEYDSDGNLKTEISLDEDGNQDGIYEYFDYNNKLASGYSYKSADLNYNKEYIYGFNDKGHWITQVILNNDEPQFLNERILEYY